MDDNMTTKKPWSRRKKALVFGAGVPVALVGTTAAAAAVFFALAGITGGGSNATFTAQFASAPLSMDSAGMALKPNAANLKVVGGKLQLPSPQFFPGESLSITASVTAGEGVAGYVSGLELPGLPAGYTAQLMSGCGASLLPYGADVTIKITAGDTLTQGETWTLSPEAGVMVTPSGTTPPTGVTCMPYVAE